MFQWYLMLKPSYIIRFKKIVRNAVIIDIGEHAYQKGECQRKCEQADLSRTINY